MTKTAIHFFLIILFGALFSAAVGGGFAALVATFSPDFVDNLFAVHPVQQLPNPVRYATAVGMIWGVFIGAAVAAFACGLSVVLRLLSLAKSQTRKPSVD